MYSNKPSEGNIKFAVTSEDTIELFSNNGYAEHIDIIEGKGFGFVEIDRQTEAEAAQKKLQGDIKSDPLLY